MPQHIVIIPNGNRTWSRARGLKSWEGYWYAYQNLSKTYQKILELGIPHLTLWGFSTENWKRDGSEITQVFLVVKKIIEDFSESLVKRKIRFQHLGRKDRLPKDLLELIEKLEQATAQFTERSINIALDYGGRDEILRAVNQLLKDKATSVNEEEFSHLLDTRDLPDPDLIIRTANEQRLSGMMPWQGVYAEYYFSPKNFPEFGPDDLEAAIIDFQKRKRTFGGDLNTNEQKLA